MSAKVLVLSRNYPNNVMRILGLWVEGLVHHLSRQCEIRVIAPVPYCPPLPGLASYSHFRSIEPWHQTNGVEVWHPRFLVGPGYWLYSFEASTYYWGIRRHVEQLRQAFPFDLIHAHFSYPDGVVATRLGQDYNIPVIITEHAPWISWMDKYAQVRRQAVAASRACAVHIAVSRYVGDTIVRFTGGSGKLQVIPVGVDGAVFAPRSGGPRPDPNQILYVGRIHSTKGVDILFQALCQLIARRPEVRLVVVGGGLPFRRYRLQEAQLRRLVVELRLQNHAEFVGPKSPDEVAEFMRKSALLVLPSRAESFGAVLVEALACGTPVVATRCGGPEDIVNDGVGLLVPKEDVEALASGIDDVLMHRDRYNSDRLRAYALENFSWEKIARDTMDLYREALRPFKERPIQQ